MTDSMSGFPPKSHMHIVHAAMFVYETVRRACIIGLQHVSMYSERGTHHFTWFVDFLDTFLRRFGRQDTNSARPKFPYH